LRPDAGSSRIPLSSTGPMDQVSPGRLAPPL